ncbi:MAG: hypothetical protein ACYSWR_02955 [Planctomycetota bacterium]|jgi:hypothetical protein
MLKKAMLGILAVALLAGAENVSAQKKKGRPKAHQKQEQVQKGQAQKRGLRSRQRGFDKWLAALTEAYRENDREKMGQLLRNMKQRRQRRQKGMGAPGKRGQHFRRERWEGKGYAEQWREGKDDCHCCCRGFKQRGRGGRAFRGKVEAWAGEARTVKREKDSLEATMSRTIGVEDHDTDVWAEQVGASTAEASANSIGTSMKMKNICPATTNTNQTLIGIGSSVKYLRI